MGKVWVISLGGSRIVPGEVDYKFLEHFKELIERHPAQRFVVVTGGGSVARKYIRAVKDLHKRLKKQSLMGIAVTRLNAYLMTEVFGKRANDKLPKDMKEAKGMLKKNQIVFCGALRYRNNNTTDGTAAALAAYLKAPFINLTNVRGIYTDNPKTHKNARFIRSISWADFRKLAEKIKYKAGQHFVLDQSASEIILKDKVLTYITGSLGDIERIIMGKSFKGSIIYGSGC